MPKGENPSRGPDHAAAVQRGRAFTDELRRLGEEIVDTDGDGNPITRRQKLGLMVWQQALGWDEKTRDENGDLKLIKHPPVAWCQQLLYDRVDGRAAVAAPSNESGLKASEKVRTLAKDRLNAMAAGKTIPPAHKP